MTNTKAIEAIKMIKDGIKFNIPVLERHYSEAFDLAIKALEGQKTGKWTDEHGDSPSYIAVCSNCKARIYISDIEHMGYDRSCLPDYCMECGAKMEVENEAL